MTYIYFCTYAFIKTRTFFVLFQIHRMTMIRYYNIRRNNTGGFFFMLITENSNRNSDPIFTVTVRVR